MVPFDGRNPTSYLVAIVTFALSRLWDFRKSRKMSNILPSKWRSTSRSRITNVNWCILVCSLVLRTYRTCKSTVVGCGWGEVDIVPQRLYLKFCLGKRYFLYGMLLIYNDWTTDDRCKLIFQKFYFNLPPKKSKTLSKKIYRNSTNNRHYLWWKKNVLIVATATTNLMT